MKQLINMINNPDNLSLDDLFIVLQNYDFYVDPISHYKVEGLIQRFIQNNLTVDSEGTYPLEGKDYLTVRSDMLDLVKSIINKKYFDLQLTGIEELYDKSNWYCNEYFKDTNKEEVLTLLKAIITGRRRYKLFMTEQKYKSLVKDIFNNKDDYSLDLLDTFSQEEIINTINKYVDLNHILVDDLVTHMREEHIVSPYLLDMVINFALAFRKKFRTRVRVLM